MNKLAFEVNFLIYRKCVNHIIKFKNNFNFVELALHNVKNHHTIFLINQFKIITV
ncbi:Uncharacterised protein [Staphylococcus argenteus]|nr:Uncharacterised protein [Staphylococcus argenteus]SGX55549.1 Uncharacterised protein [Staphylococcus argenteus]